MLNAKENLLTLFQSIRRKTQELCQPLLNEDYVIQSCEDVSPPKWHLAHTTWFFETFVLKKYLKNYTFYDNLFASLFNSYYQALGQPFPRMERGSLARPPVEKVYAYRKYVDHILAENFESLAEQPEVMKLLQLGLHHEQQHQELLLMDIKYNFSIDPSFPSYRHQLITNSSTSTLKFIEMEGGTIEIGHEGQTFCFDNELPRHACILKPYEIADRLITNGEYLEFITAGGYEDPRWWLADGWESKQRQQWSAPLYWQSQGNQWLVFTLRGLHKLSLDEPVSHISFYEADAFARFKQARLPTESEWEHAAKRYATMMDANFLETNILHPQTQLTSEPQQFLGDLWEWTSSPYTAYPGYQPFSGELGEYNGKFMSNQMILRGGACVTPQTHIRLSYRNFFQPDKRWQFSGIRLAKTLSE